MPKLLDTDVLDAVCQLALCEDIQQEHRDDGQQTAGLDPGLDPDGVECGLTADKRCQIHTQGRQSHDQSPTVGTQQLLCQIVFVEMPHEREQEYGDNGISGI